MIVPDVRMQRTLDIDLLPRLGPTLHKLKIPRDSPPLRIRHDSRASIAHPSMGSSPPTIHPKHMFEAEILRQRRLHDFNRHDDEFPAFEADVSRRAACTNRVVICEIDVEDEFFGDGPEGGLFDEGLAVARVGGVDGADLEA